MVGAFAYLELGLVKRDPGDVPGALEMLRAATAYPVPEADPEPWKDLVLRALSARAARALAQMR